MKVFLKDVVKKTPCIGICHLSFALLAATVGFAFCLLLLWYQSWHSAGEVAGQMAFEIRFFKYLWGNSCEGKDLHRALGG